MLPAISKWVSHILVHRLALISTSTSSCIGHFVARLAGGVCVVGINNVRMRHLGTSSSLDFVIEDCDCEGKEGENK